MMGSWKDECPKHWQVGPRGNGPQVPDSGSETSL